MPREASQWESESKATTAPIWPGIYRLIQNELTMSDMSQHEHSSRPDVYRLASTVRCLEPFMLLGCFLSIDIVTSFIFITPLKAILTLALWLVRGVRPSASQKRHLLSAGLLLSCASCVHLCNSLFDLSYSHFYHLIRRQSYFKVWTWVISYHYRNSEIVFPPVVLCALQSESDSGSCPIHVWMRCDALLRARRQSGRVTSVANRRVAHVRVVLLRAHPGALRADRDAECGNELESGRGDGGADVEQHQRTEGGGA